MALVTAKLITQFVSQISLCALVIIERVNALVRHGKYSQANDHFASGQ